MTRSQQADSAHLRGFRWMLQPVERKLDAAVEGARLVLAALQRQLDALQQTAQQHGKEQQAQEALALEWIRRDVHAGAHAMRHLASLEVERLRVDADRIEMEQRVATARAECIECQRRVESVQALRRSAQRQHAEASLRRQWKDADDAWLAFTQQRRASGPREEPEAP